ncbi:MAG: sugar transporter [Bacteroidetes bacterium]|nr:sugar transporter [Bacteroidota bacterium]
MTYKSSILSLFLGGLLLAVPAAMSQTRDEIRQQAEQQLKKMTPEEIERKLKELGMSRWEAIRRAQDFGITLEEYLSKTAAPAEAPAAVVEAAKVVVPTEKKTPPTVKEVGVVTIPGFSGRSGIDVNIRPFGFEIFELPPSTFEPIVNVATPPSYILGPGDELTITVWGETKLYYQISVNREGNVIIPEVGPVSANGQTIQQFKDKLLRRMTEAVILCLQCRQYYMPYISPADQQFKERFGMSSWSELEREPRKFTYTTISQKQTVRKTFVSRMATSYLSSRREKESL